MQAECSQDGVHALDVECEHLLWGSETFDAIRLVSLGLGFETRLVGPAVLLGGVLVWLWPIGIGGQDAGRRAMSRSFSWD